MIMTPPDGGLWPGFEVWLWGTENNPVLHIHERVYANGNEEGRDIEVGAIAVWRELLGYDDPLEALEAIIHVDDHRPQQEDPETGISVWAEPYILLQAREEARAKAALQAAREGCAREEVVERASEAAYNSVHQSINGGECAMDRCRRVARERLGCADPTRNCGTETRTEVPVLSEVPSRLARVFQPAMSRRAMLLEGLAGAEPLIARQGQRFLHALSGQEHDLLSPELEPGPGENPPPAEEILAKYQGAA